MTTQLWAFAGAVVALVVAIGSGLGIAVAYLCQTIGSM